MYSFKAESLILTGALGGIFPTEQMRKLRYSDTE